MDRTQISRRSIRFSFDSSIGPIGLTASAEGLLTVTLHPHSAAKVKAAQPPVQFTRLIQRLEAYFRGVKVSFPDKLELSAATPFQTKVWTVTRSIPYGETRSYRWIAEQIGQPAAAHAVGQALGKNPLPIIVPCHRVTASDGSLGGYSGGLEMKRRLLHLESSI